jgi:hypothetical protein
MKPERVIEACYEIIERLDKGHRGTAEELASTLRDEAQAELEAAGEECLTIGCSNTRGKHSRCCDICDKATVMAYKRLKDAKPVSPDTRNLMAAVLLAGRGEKMMYSSHSGANRTDMIDDALWMADQMLARGAGEG